MSTVYSIKKGLDIKLLGEAEKTIVDLNAKRFAIKPTDFVGCFPKMIVKEGDTVNVGDQLFFGRYSAKDRRRRRWICRECRCGKSRHYDKGQQSPNHFVIVHAALPLVFGGDMPLQASLLRTTSPSK